MVFPSRRFLALAACFGLSLSVALYGKALEPKQRLASASLKQAMMGALLFLDDQQVRQRQGSGDPRFDACSGDGCRPTLPGTGTSLPLPLPFVKNRAGEWANFIHIFPSVLGAADKQQDSLIEIQDSNLFMTAGISYPLYLFDESELSGQQPQTVTAMRILSLASLEGYKHEDRYSFWPKLPGSTSKADRVGPLNIPMALGEGMTLMKKLHIKPQNPNPIAQEWMEDVSDRQINPYGLDALANIPGDADDTALALSVGALGERLDHRPFHQDGSPFERMLSFRDQGRTLEDARDTWKGKNSGGFLTWLKDENLPREERFRSPSSGVIPLGVNNVDCIVNANVLLSFGLQGRTDEPAVLEASELMLRAVERRAWPTCGLYYPQRMMFPYVFTRAFRDGHVQNAATQKAAEQLLFDLLAEQDDTARRWPKQAGAFSGGTDPSFDLATALGVTALLNIGPEIPARLNVSERYQEAIQKGIDYLLAHAEDPRIRFDSTFNTNYDQAHFPLPWDKSKSWQAGVFFSASNWNLAQWRSQAYSTAIVLEALGKYMLAYDRVVENFVEGRRIHVLQYARNAKKAAEDFSIRVND